MRPDARISICIPCHNSAPFLGEALDSALSQDYPNFEVVVVDDGSTDGSEKILEEYAGRGVTVIQQVNRGASAARNVAYRASTGKAVLFMDSDDLIPSSHLSALASRVDGPHVIAMGQWDRFYASPFEATFPHRHTYRDASGPEWLATGGWHMMQSAMFLLPRQHINLCGAWNETRSPFDDFEFFSRLISRAAGLRFAPDAKVYYRSGIAGSLSSRRSRPYVEGQFESLMLGTKHLLSVEDSPRARRAAANVLQAFDYDHYPRHADLRSVVRARVAELGGADVTPNGPPGFHRLRAWIGWKAARHVQHLAENLQLNSAARAIARP